MLFHKNFVKSLTTHQRPERTETSGNIEIIDEALETFSDDDSLEAWIPIVPGASKETHDQILTLPQNEDSSTKVIILDEQNFWYLSKKVLQKIQH